MFSSFFFSSYLILLYFIFSSSSSTSFQFSLSHSFSLFLSAHSFIHSLIHSLSFLSFLLYLILDDPPRLVHTFEEKILYPGNSLSLSCSAVGSPLAQIQWSIDGTNNMPDSSRFRIGDYVTRDNRTISYVNISNVRSDDGGLYRCSAKNEIGSTWHEARINIYGPPAIKSMPNITALAGETIYLLCRFHGYPIQSITWYSRGECHIMDS